MEMNSEASKIAGEDSGIAAAMSCQSCLGDAKGSEVNKETKQLPKEFWGEGTSPDLDVGKTAGEKGRGPDTGRMDEEEDAELAVETRESAPALLKEEMNDSATESVAASPDAPGAAKGTSAAESEFGVPESLSMKSLSRSLTKEDVTSLSAPAEQEPKELERGRELGRSQTIPRSFGAQSRRSAAQRLEMQSGGTQASADTSVKVNRSTNFGMSGGNSVKRMLLEWCRSKTRDYKYVDIQNFSSCWSDGMAFCALVHKFFPESFDYSALSPKNRKHNFELAFSTAEARADCDPLIEVDDMVRMGRRPDPMCVFTYVQSLCRHLRKLEPVPTATPTGEAT